MYVQKNTLIYAHNNIILSDRLVINVFHKTTVNSNIIFKHFYKRRCLGKNVQRATPQILHVFPAHLNEICRVLRITLEDNDVF